MVKKRIKFSCTLNSSLSSSVSGFAPHCTAAPSELPLAAPTPAPPRIRSAPLGSAALQGMVSCQAGVAAQVGEGGSNKRQSYQQQQQQRPIRRRLDSFKTFCSVIKVKLLSTAAQCKKVAPPPPTSSLSSKPALHQSEATLLPGNSGKKRRSHKRKEKHHQQERSNGELQTDLERAAAVGEGSVKQRSASGGNPLATGGMGGARSLMNRLSSIDSWSSSLRSKATLRKCASSKVQRRGVPGLLSSPAVPGDGDGDITGTAGSSHTQTHPLNKSADDVLQIASSAFPPTKQSATKKRKSKARRAGEAATKSGSKKKQEERRSEKEQEEKQREQETNKTAVAFAEDRADCAIRQEQRAGEHRTAEQQQQLKVEIEEGDQKKEELRRPRELIMCDPSTTTTDDSSELATQSSTYSPSLQAAAPTHTRSHDSRQPPPPPLMTEWAAEAANENEALFDGAAMNVNGGVSDATGVGAAAAQFACPCCSCTIYMEFPQLQKSLSAPPNSKHPLLCTASQSGGGGGAATEEPTNWFFSGHTDGEDEEEESGRVRAADNQKLNKKKDGEYNEDEEEEEESTDACDSMGDWDPMYASITVGFEERARCEISCKSCGTNFAVLRSSTSPSSATGLGEAELCARAASGLFSKQNSRTLPTHSHSHAQNAHTAGSIGGGAGGGVAAAAGVNPGFSAWSGREGEERIENTRGNGAGLFSEEELEEYETRLELIALNLLQDSRSICLSPHKFPLGEISTMSFPATIINALE